MRLAVRLLLAALLGLAVLAPAAAHAEKKTFSDTRGDVQVFEETVDSVASDDTELPPARPSRTDVGDVLRTAVRHDGDRIAVRMRLGEVSRRISSGYAFVFAGSNGKRIRGFVDNSVGAEGIAFFQQGDERPVCERGVRHRIDYRGDTVSLSFPRRCLGDPRRIRVAAAAVWSREGDTLTTADAYDVAGRDGGRVDRRWGFSDAVRHTR